MDLWKDRARFALFGAALVGAAWCFAEALHACVMR